MGSGSTKRTESRFPSWPSSSSAAASGPALSRSPAAASPAASGSSDDSPAPLAEWREDVVGGAEFAPLARIHACDGRGHGPNHGERVRDKQWAESEPRLELLE